MSAFLDKADEMKARLEAVEALDGIPVLVDRQKDLSSDFQRAMGKVRGTVIIIFFSGYSTEEPEISDSTVRSDYVVTIWTKPVLKKDQLPADDIVSEVHKSLQGWKLGQFCHEKLSITRGRVVPNKQFLIHELRSQITHHL